MGRDWRLSIPMCISQQSAFRMVIKISSGSFIHTDELKILQPKRSVLSCSICRASDRDLLLSWWEIQLHLLRRKDRVCDACSPPSRPPPTSSLHSKEEFVQWCSYWLYSYRCAKKTRESLISSSFLLFLGLGVLRREAWILKLSFDGSFSWVICYSSLPCSFFPQGCSLHTCRRLVLSLLYYRIIYCIYEKLGKCFLTAIMTTLKQTGQ